MKMTNAEYWRNTVTTIEKLVAEQIRNKRNVNKEETKILYHTLELAMECYIDNLTISDIIEFMKKQLGKDAKTDDKSIIEFISDEQNREMLMEFGLQKKSGNTLLNDMVKNNIPKAQDDHKDRY